MTEPAKKYRAPIFNPRRGLPPARRDRCRAATFAHHQTYQCMNRPKEDRELIDHEGTFGFCGLHDPRRIAERDEKKRVALEVRRDAERSRDAARRMEDALKTRALDAIRQIADGHDDPRGLARKVLGGGEAE